MPRVEAEGRLRQRVLGEGVNSGEDGTHALLVTQVAAKGCPGSVLPLDPHKPISASSSALTFS